MINKQDLATIGRYLLFLLVLGSFLEINAQYAENIRSGRPGLAVGPFTVGKGVLQNQSGIYMNNTEFTDGNKTGAQNNYAISVFRGGLTENFELGCAFSYAEINTSYVDSLRLESDRDYMKGINLFSLAMRVNITEGKGLRPAFGYQINLSLPLVAEGFKRRYPAPRITLLTAQSFEKFRFITNWAAIWNGNDAEPTGLYMLFLDRGFGKKVRFFVEHYGSLSNNELTLKFDMGLTYLVNKDVQLDVQYGNGPESRGISDYFVSFGIGWRVRLQNRSDA